MFYYPLRSAGLNMAQPHELSIGKKKKARCQKADSPRVERIEEEERKYGYRGGEGQGQGWPGRVGVYKLRESRVEVYNQKAVGLLLLIFLVKLTVI